MFVLRQAHELPSTAGGWVRELVTVVSQGYLKWSIDSGFKTLSLAHQTTCSIPAGDVCCVFFGRKAGERECETTRRKLASCGCVKTYAR